MGLDDVDIKIPAKMATGEQILKAYETLQNKNIHYAPLFGDGNATQKIVTQIISTLEQKK